MAVLAQDTVDALTRLARDVEADFGVHLYIDRGDGVLELMASVRDGEALSGAAIAAMPDSDAPAETGLLRRWLSGGNKDGDSAGAVAHLSLPEERAGLLVLERKRSEPFSDEDLAIARVKGRQLVSNVATRLGPRPIAWSAQLEAVQSVAAQLTRLTNMEEISAALCTQTQRVVAYDNARVYVLRDDGQTLEPVAFRSHAREYHGETVTQLRVMVGEGITGWVAATGQQLIVDDAANDSRAVRIPESPELAEESMMLTPLRSESRIIGVVVLSRLGLARFSDDELRLLGVLADQAAVAIENARLLAERDRHVSELQTLLDVAEAGDGASDERDLANVLATKLCGASHMDACLISRWEEQSGRLVPIGAHGRPLIGPERDLGAHRTLRHVLMHDEPAWLDPRHDDVDPAEVSRLHQLGGVATMLMPLSTGGRVTGVLELISERPGRRFSESETKLLRAMANQAASALENARLLRQLRDAAQTDPVTGIYSHRHLQDRIRQETARAARTRSPMSLLMIDLDDFKRINDEHGHQAGDRVLRAIAGALRAAVRTSDVVARYGGDEFVVLMPDTDEPESLNVAARAEQAVADILHPMTDGSAVHVTCSLGLALYPRDGRSGKALLRAADAAMYTHKRARASVSRRARTSGAAESSSGAPGPLAEGSASPTEGVAGNSVA